MKKAQIVLFVLLGLFLLFTLFLVLFFTRKSTHSQSVPFPPDQRIKEHYRGIVEYCMNLSYLNPSQTLFLEGVVPSHQPIFSQEKALSILKNDFSHRFSSCIQQTGLSLSDVLILEDDNELLFRTISNVPYRGRNLEVRVERRFAFPLEAMLLTLEDLRQGLNEGVLITKDLPLPVSLYLTTSYLLIQNPKYGISLQMVVPT